MPDADGHQGNLIGTHTLNAGTADQNNLLKKGEQSMKRISPDREIKARKNWKKDLEFIVMLILMLTVLLFAFLLINNIGIRYILYMILAVFSSIKVTEWLTNNGEY